MPWNYRKGRNASLLSRVTLLSKVGSMINFESKWLLVASVALSSFACSLKEASTNPLAAEPDNVGEVDESGAGGGARVTSASSVASVRTLPPQSSAAGGVSSVNQVTPGTTAVVVSSVSSSGANQSNAAAGGATQRSSAAGGAIQNNSSVTPAGGAPSVSLGSGGMGVSTLTLASSTTAKPVESVGPIGSGGTSAAPVSGAEEVTPLGLGGVTPTSESKRQLPAHWVTGYYVGYQSSKHPPSEIDFSALSHLVMGAALVKADGSVDLSFYVGDANAGGTLARDVAKRAHAAGKRALLMVGGAGNGAAIASAVKNRFDVFVSNLV